MYAVLVILGIVEFFTMGALQFSDNLVQMDVHTFTRFLGPIGPTHFQAAWEMERKI